ncbi:MAG TPA: LysM domain-containing protein [Solirubrobacterales bacterium]|nr:LysM domain-containing protein [Solirubrobacterales bacterium]
MIVLIATTLGGGGGGDGGGSGGGSAPAGQANRSHRKVHTPKSYVVQSGDTLTSIAHENGVPVARILRLNPGVDPQILIAGETLKLK